MSNGESILKPTSAEEVADIVRAAIADSSKLRTAQPADNEPLLVGERLLNLSHMAAVVDYPARDMTITVQAGMPADELGRILAEERQQLPIDCFDRAMSVGAMVASDVAGPRQYGYGTLRDYVIGIEAVDGQGRIFHAGGRVVKNVAGYDLCRLMVGSRGSLAIVTQVTFKLKPLPEQSLVASFRFPNYESLDTALNRLNLSAATPVLIDLAAGPNSDNDRGDLPRLSVGVEGTDTACDWQAQQIRSECGDAATLTFDSRDPGHRPPGSPEFRVPEHCRGFGYGWGGGRDTTTFESSRCHQRLSRSRRRSPRLVITSSATRETASCTPSRRTRMRSCCRSLKGSLPNTAAAFPHGKRLIRHVTQTRCPPGSGRPSTRTACSVMETDSDRVFEI